MARNAALLSGPPFARFSEKTRKHLLDNIYALCGAPLAERDMNAAGMNAAQIRAVLKCLEKPHFLGATKLDARIFIPGGYVTPLQARDLHASGSFFKPHAKITDAMAMMWHTLAQGAGRERSDDDKFQNIRALGSTAFPLDILQNILWRLGKHDAESVAAIAASLPVTEMVNGSLALKRASNVERELLARVESRAKRSVSATTEFRKSVIAFDDKQHAAIDLGLNRRISIVTGPPGCGKTSICRAIADNLDDVLGVALAARAAHVLGERADIETETAFKILTMPAGKRADLYDGLDALIIDECSMLPSTGLRDLLRIADKLEIERVILIGDPEQLPPIDEGRPFADLIEAGIAPVTRLATNYRSAAGGGIAALADDIRQGAFTKNRLLGGAYADVISVHEKGEDKSRIAVLARYRELIESGASPSDIAILVPFKKPRYALSTIRLNTAVREYLGYSTTRAHVGEIVIGTENDYKRGIINGTIGVIDSIDKDTFAIMFEDTDALSISRAEDFGKGILPNNVDFGYAFTIHRAQGSEFEHVIVAVNGADDFLLRKSSFYTAVTRARTSLSIIGDLDAAEAMSRSEDRRTTVLQALLGLPAPPSNTTLDRLVAGRDGDAVNEEIEF